MPVYYFVVAVVVGVGVGLWRKSWRVGMLVGYMIVLFSSMVLNRPTSQNAKTWLYLFDSYTNRPIGETLSNIISFIPIGILAGRKWKGILVGVGFSFFIEITQLLFHKGFFEPDDILNNTIGTAIGCIITKTIIHFCEKESFNPKQE